MAVAKALTVLNDFYAKAADATAFVQGPAEDAPATFDKPYRRARGARRVSHLQVQSRLKAPTEARRWIL